MSERGRGHSNHRGGERGARGGRGGHRGGRGGHNNQQDKHKKESILDLSKYMDKEIRVQFQGGREMIGTLKGYDPLLNLVLDNTTENKKDLEGESNTDNKRTLGLSVLRGTSIILISPLDGMEQIENPFGH